MGDEEIKVQMAKSEHAEKAVKVVNGRHLDNAVLECELLSSVLEKR